MSLSKYIGKVDVLENGQPIDLLPKGDNILGIPLDYPGPIVLGNEPERSLRPGQQMVDNNLADPINLKPKNIKVNPITGQQEFVITETQTPAYKPQHKLVPGAKEYTPEELGYVKSPTPKQCKTCKFFKNPNTCTFPMAFPADPNEGCCNEWEEKKGLQEGVKDGYDHAFKFDTGDYEKTSGGGLDTITAPGQRPLEISNEFSSALYDDQINYEPSYYNRQNEDNQPYMQRPGEYPLKLQPVDPFQIKEAQQPSGERWITVNGHHIKIRAGQKIGDAISEWKYNLQHGIHVEPVNLLPESPPITLEPVKMKAVDFDTAAKRFDEFRSKTKKVNYSFDPTTGQSYNVKRPEEAKVFYKKFADGKSPLFVIGVTNHGGELSRESHAAYEQIKNDQQHPLVGHWKSDKSGFDYTDISFPVDGGKSLDEAKKLGKNYGQESIIQIKPDGKVRFVNT